MRIRLGWRRFRPARPAATLESSVEGDNRLIEAAFKEVCDLARNVRTGRFGSFDAAQLQPVMADYLRRVGALRSAHELLVLLLLRAPAAAAAQRQMDKHPHGYRDRQARLMELIDFNDAYVSVVLALPAGLLPNWNAKLKLAIDRLCHRFGSRSFSDEQWQAITYGLGREIAVYRGAIAEGLTAAMTGRSLDAMGVDMVIGDETGRSVNVDVKTRSSFHFRIKDLVREGRVSSAQGALAEERGYCPVTNGHGPDEVSVVLVRIDRETLGEIVDFAFENAHLLGRQLRLIINQFGRQTERPLH